jgi:apolipoprotein N-acyltransferase
MNSRWGFLVAAILGALAFPPVSLWPLAYVALVPFLIAASDTSRVRVFGPAWRAGVLFYSGVLYWVGLNSGAPLWMSMIAAFAMICILATIWGMVAWVVQRAAKSLSMVEASLLFVVTYSALEVFWGTGELSLPWATWALPITAFYPAMQVAEWVDTQGLAFLVLSINALLFLFWKTRSKNYLAVGFALIFLPMIWGVFRAAQVDQSSSVIHAASVQANTPPESKWQMSAAEILEDHVQLTDSLAETNSQFVCWPETAVPTAIRFRQWAADTLRAVAQRNDVTILTGATDYDMTGGEEVPYNAAFVIRPDSFGFQRSSKIHLVPFGERIPGQKIFPFLHDVHLGQAEFKPGDSVVVFSGGKLPPFTCLICFEVIYSDIAAAAVLKGAQFFGHVTNDGWYGNSSGPYQHLALSKLRAVVTRRSIVRAANTGISALILPSGRFEKTLGYDQAGVIFGDVPTRTDVTLAVRLSKLWSILYYGLFAVALAVVWMRAQRYGSPEAA